MYRTVTLLLVVSAPAYAADFEHVLLILVDDVGVDKVGAWADDAPNPGEDRPSTPTIDLLASAGVRFTDAWATPACSPTRAMLYSGEAPSRNGVGTVIAEGSTTRLSTSSVTLAKVAAESGLRAGLFGKWHVGESSSSPDAPTTVPLALQEYPIQLGFTWFAGNMDGEVESYTEWLYTTSKRSGSGAWRTTATTLTTSATEKLTDDAVAWMNTQSSQGKRRLTVASYHLPHATRNEAGAWSWADAAESCGAAASADEAENFSVATECVDAELAELLATTANLEDTLVIFLGDNGTQRGVSEGYFADGRGKGTLYESGVRVPFVIADGAAVAEALEQGLVTGEGYRIGAGLVATEPASVVDVYATVVDYLGLTSTSCADLGVDCARDSVSLRPVLDGGASPRDDVWTETWSATGTSGVGAAALRAGDFKLMVSDASGESCRRYELYDLAADRWETTDLYGDPNYAAEQADLLTRLAVREAQMTYDWLSDSSCAD